METAGFAASVLIGLSLGLIGGGGSILTVPILVYFFGIAPVTATTDSLFIVGLAIATGAVSHYRKGNINLKVGLAFGLPSLITVFIMRKWVLPAVPSHLMNLGHFVLTKNILVMLLFSLLMLSAAIPMIRPQKPAPLNKLSVNYFKLALQSLAVGTITGFVGVGGGFLIIPSLVLFAGLPMKKAIGTSLMIMAASSLLGVIGDLSAHAVIDYFFLLKFSAFAVAGIAAGSFLSRHIKEKMLRPAFGWFVLTMGILVLTTTLNK